MRELVSAEIRSRTMRRAEDRSWAMRREDSHRPSHAAMWGRASRGAVPEKRGAAAAVEASPMTVPTAKHETGVSARAALEKVEAVFTTSRSLQGLFQCRVMCGALDAVGFLEAYTALFESGGPRCAVTLGASESAGKAWAALQQACTASSTLHRLKQYSWEEDFGEAGAWLRELVLWCLRGVKRWHQAPSTVLRCPERSPSFMASAALLGLSCPHTNAGMLQCLLNHICARRYDYKDLHKAFKASNGRDTLLSGLGGALLLLRWQDTETYNTSVVATMANWSEVAHLVRKGLCSFGDLQSDIIDMRAARAIAMAIGRADVVRTLFAASPEGFAFAASHSGGGIGSVADAAELEKHVTNVSRYMESWGMSCKWSQESAALMARCLGTVLLPDDDPALAESAEWLPSPSQLLNIAGNEKAWDVFMVGAQHPALLGGLMYARIGRWREASFVAEGMLKHILQPLARIEALRLLARCDAAQGLLLAAQKTRQRAADEARQAQYFFLECELLAANDEL